MGKPWISGFGAGKGTGMREKKKSGLTTAIFIGLLLGAATGVGLHYKVPAGMGKGAGTVGRCFSEFNDVMMGMTVGLPVEAIALIMGTDRILDMSRTAVNITGDAVCTTVVAWQSGAVDRQVFCDMEAGGEEESL